MSEAIFVSSPKQSQVFMLVDKFELAGSERSYVANVEKDNCYLESDALDFYYLCKRELFFWVLC